MAIAFTIEKTKKTNEVIITSTGSTSFYWTLKVLASNGTTFSLAYPSTFAHSGTTTALPNPLEDFPNITVSGTNPQYMITGDTITFSYSSDNLYRFDFSSNAASSSPTSSYFLLNDNLNTCKKLLIKNLLCSTSDCNEKQFTLTQRKYTKFKYLTDWIYYLMSRIYQVQTLAATVSIPSPNLISISEMLYQALSLCDTCADDDNCVDCSKNNLTSPDCGCN